MIEGTKSILIISALDVWTIGPHEGSQARWYTLKSYAEHNWNVHFITSYRERNFDKEITSPKKISNLAPFAFKKIYCDARYELYEVNSSHNSTTKNLILDSIKIL